MAQPPTIAVITDDGLVCQLRAALRAEGYRAVRVPTAEVTDAAALRTFLARHELDAVVYDAHARTVSPTTFQQVYELGVTHDFDVVVAAMYDNPEREPEDEHALSQPPSRRMSVADVVRAVNRLVGPPL